MPLFLPHSVWSYKESLAVRPTPVRPFGGSRKISTGTTNCMKLLRTALASILILAICAPTYSDQANSAFKNGARAESHTQYDAAYEAYGQAIRLKPKDPKYMVAYLRVRILAAAEHLQKGKLLRNNLKLQEALAEFQRAAEIDSTNHAAQQELQSTADMIKKQAEQAAGAAAPKPESPLAKK